jgi:hypothetical protein
VSDQSGLLTQFAHKFSEYLPTLVAGLLVLALGLAVGWVAKQAVVRVLRWLRLDRLGARTGWRAAFEKGDVRAALYDGLGTVTFVLVVLVFLDNALQIWGLTVLSRALDSLVVYLPNLGLVALIAGVGAAIASAAASRAEDALAEDGVGRARLIAKLLKGALLAVVAAVALWQLNLARQIVLAGFLILFGAMGIAFALAVGIGSAKAVQSGWEELSRKRKDE